MSSFHLANALAGAHKPTWISWTADSWDFGLEPECLGIIVEQDSEGAPSGIAKTTVVQQQMTTTTSTKNFGNILDNFFLHDSRSIRFDSGFSVTFELFFPPSDREILFYDLTSIFMENFQFYRRTFKLNCSPLLFWKEPFKMLFSFFLSYWDSSEVSLSFSPLC